MLKIQDILLANLTANQAEAVKSSKRRLLVVAGAGSGKTEVMARKIAWWVGVNKVPKDKIVAFTFTERAAEEMKFRIRNWIEKTTPPGEEVSLGSMYIGTIHGFCLAKIREFWPDIYHNYDILDEGSRAALILRGFHNLLGLEALRGATGQGRYATLQNFIQAYDQLHEHNCFEVELPGGEPPHELGGPEIDWIKKAELKTRVGNNEIAKAFGRSAGRYYAYLRCRRFLDFSTSQSEFLRQLCSDQALQKEFETNSLYLVVDEIQDINPVQRKLIEILVGTTGRLTAVGDHRQSIYGFRGAKVEIIAQIWKEFNTSTDAKIVDLQENFRSTPRIIDLANRWAETIGKLGSMKTVSMKHGNANRTDHDTSHLALVSFSEREEEASWIAEAIKILVPTESEGALHDKRDGSKRGLTLSDIAVFVRSSTDVRTYMQALESAGIPCVVKAGPDLFSQPEVLLFVATLAITADCQEFFGSPHNSKSLPSRIKSVLGCEPKPAIVFREAAKVIRSAGLAFNRDVEDRLFMVARAMRKRINNENSVLTEHQASKIQNPSLRSFLLSKNSLQRVFPQKLFHMLISEAEVSAWDTCEGRGQAAFFHLGALSGLITGIETPGWTSVSDYSWQMIGLFQFGAEAGRTDEQPLMVQPDAVNISTIHAAKGLEFGAVFLADVNARRFPSIFAKRKPDLPLSGSILKKIDINDLADNENNDGERRLMYVALTRAERFLFVSHSGKQTSKFIKELKIHVDKSGGLVTKDSKTLLSKLKYAPKEHQRDIRIATSFSDLRYYLECPHDFYLRKVLGFSPTIDQAFGYGRGVHNLMRAIHSNPEKWAELANNRTALKKEIQTLIDQGLFYLRYTTGQPAANMRAKGLQIAADYIERYVDELKNLTFEPEKEFETLVEYEDGNGGALVSGAIDIVRQDDPPRVTLIDFKSGDPDSDFHQKLDEQQMQLQVALYAFAAKKELEYQPEKGLVRYLDPDDISKAELNVPLDGDSLNKAKGIVAEAAKNIRERYFASGPLSLPKDKKNKTRCAECDFGDFCGMETAIEYRKSRKK